MKISSSKLYLVVGHILTDPNVLSVVKNSSSIQYLPIGQTNTKKSPENPNPLLAIVNFETSVCQMLSFPALGHILIFLGVMSNF